MRKLANGIKVSLSSFDADISGMISLGLALGDPGTVSSLRQILSKMLVEKLLIHHGECPPPEASHYREKLFDLFLPWMGVDPSRKKQNQRRRTVIAYFLNGHLDQPTVTHFCPFACCESYPATLRRMSRFLTAALVPKKPGIFTRTRWTGSDVVLDWCGLLCGAHNFLPELVQRFLGGASLAKAKAAPEIPEALPTASVATAAGASAASGESAWTDIFLEEQQQHQQQGQQQHAPPPKEDLQPRPKARRQKASCTPNKYDKQQAPQVQAVEAPNINQEAEEGEAAAAKGFDFAEFKRQQRTLAKAWLATEPFVRLCVLKDT